MLAVSELLCYAAIAVVLDRKYRRNARKSGEWTKKWVIKLQDFSHVNLLKELRFHPKDRHNFLRMNEIVFGGLGVACWPLVPNFAGSNPAEAFGFLGRKNPQHAFLRRKSKAVGPTS